MRDVSFTFLVIFAAKSLQSCLTLCDPLDCSPVAHQAPPSMGFSRQEYWSELPFSSPEDLPNPGIELASLAFPVLTGGFFITSPTRKTQVCKDSISK